MQSVRERDQLVTLLDACSDIQLPPELLECGVVLEGLLLPLPHSTVLYFTSFYCLYATMLHLLQCIFNQDFALLFLVI